MTIYEELFLSSFLNASSKVRSSSLYEVWELIFENL